MKINFKYINDSINLQNSMDCQSDETILNIKKKLCKDSIIEESQLKLIFSEKLLKDEEVIQDINILEDDTLYVFINSVNNNRENENLNFTKILNILNNFQNVLQDEKFQNNINNTMNQFQQSFQNTLESNEFQQGIHTISESLQQIQQDFQNTLDSEEFQNNINNTINIFQDNMSNINSFNNFKNNNFSKKK